MTLALLLVLTARAAPLDLDGDGFAPPADCDDADGAVWPGAPEALGDGVDQDCTGADLVDAAALGYGDLLLTEILRDPAAVPDDAGEWVEIANTRKEDASLDGIALEGGSGVVKLGGVVPAGGLVVVGRSADPGVNGGAPVSWAYDSDLLLGDGADYLRLLGPAGLIDAVAWDDGKTFPAGAGAAMSLDPAAMDADLNDAGSAWCAAVAAFGAGDLGTPGTANPACPPVVPADADGDGFDVSLDCDDADGATYPGAPEACGEAVDRDCDGAGSAIDADADGWYACEECDDGNDGVSPGSPEVCGGGDEDCDALEDDADPDLTGAPRWYADTDGDGFGVTGADVGRCAPDPGMVDVGGDCDDGDPDRAPGAEEVAEDGVDQDCDGVDRFGGFGDDPVVPDDDAPADPPDPEEEPAKGCDSTGGAPAVAALLAQVLALGLTRRRQESA